MLKRTRSTEAKIGTKRPKVKPVKLMERWDLRRLIQLANSTLKPEQSKAIMSVLRRGKKCEGGDYVEIETEYRYGKDSGNRGRIYACSSSFQNVNGFIRRLCSYGRYADIDIKNSAPTILLQIATQKGYVATPVLRRYVENRDALINDVICVDLALSFKRVKEAFCVVIFNGNYTQKTFNQTHEILDAFTTEMKGLCEFLIQHKDFQETAESCRDKGNVYGTFLSRIYCDAENSVIQAVAEFFEARGFTIGAYVFDGVMILLDDKLDPPANFLEAAANYAFEQTGYQIELTQKSLQPTPKDFIQIVEEEDILTHQCSPQLF